MRSAQGNYSTSVFEDFVMLLVATNARAEKAFLAYQTTQAMCDKYDGASCRCGIAPGSVTGEVVDQILCVVAQAV